MNIIKCTNNRNTTKCPNRKIEYIVLHYTGNTSSRAGCARNNAHFFATTANGSADFIVDDVEIVQYNPDIENAYTYNCGDKKYSNGYGIYYGKCGNRNSIGIEICSNNTTRKVTDCCDGNWYFTEATLNNVEKLCNYLMEKYNINVDHVITHNMVSGKCCPAVIGWGNGNTTELDKFKERLEDGDMTQEKFNQMMDAYLAQQASIPPDWESADVQWGLDNGLLADPNKTMPKKFITRGEFIAVLHRFHDKLVK